jgi:rhodanese-related sulfurtransferase
MTAIEATNRGVADMPWVMLTSTPPVETVGVDAVVARGRDTLLLDVREPEEYLTGHVPGAENIPQADLATRLHELPRDRPLMVICQVGSRSLRAAQFLTQVGFSRVANVAGGTRAWSTAGHPLVTGEVPVKGPRIVESEWGHAGGG